MPLSVRITRHFAAPYGLRLWISSSLLAMTVQGWTKNQRATAAMAAESIISSVRQWSGKLDDDLTVLVCDYIPTVGGGGF